MPTDTHTKPERQTRTGIVASQTRVRVAQTRASTEGAAEQISRSKDAISQARETLKKSAKLGAEKLTPEEQRRRFIEAAREAGASEDVEDFRANLKLIAKAPAKSGRK